MTGGSGGEGEVEIGELALLLLLPVGAALAVAEQALTLEAIPAAEAGTRKPHGSCCPVPQAPPDMLLGEGLSSIRKIRASGSLETIS